MSMLVFQYFRSSFYFAFNVILAAVAQLLSGAT